MSEPRWLTRLQVDVFHDQEVLRRGGFGGVRDSGAIESALARPQQKWAYGEPSTSELAAAYGFGLAKNDGYLDGKKRVAFMAIYVFLGLNGYTIRRPEPEIVLVMTRVASGEWSEEEFATWIEDASEPRSPEGDQDEPENS